MIRILIENVLLFLLPTALYLLYVVVQRRSVGAGPASTRAALDDAPLLWLFLAGALTVVAVLAAFGSNTGGKPGEAYEPPSIRDGRIVPGHQAATQDAPPAPAKAPPTATGPAGDAK